MPVSNPPDAPVPNRAPATPATSPNTKTRLRGSHLFLFFMLHPPASIASVLEEPVRSVLSAESDRGRGASAESYGPLPEGRMDLFRLSAPQDGKDLSQHEALTNLPNGPPPRATRP